MMSLCPFVLSLPAIVLFLLSSSLLAMALVIEVSGTDGNINATQQQQQQQQQGQGQGQQQGQGQGISSSDELVVDVTFNETSPKTNESLHEKGKKVKEAKEEEPFLCSALCWILIIVCGVTIGAIGVTTIVLFTVRYHNTRGQIDQQGVQMNAIPRSSIR